MCFSRRSMRCSNSIAAGLGRRTRKSIKQLNVRTYAVTRVWSSFRLRQHGTLRLLVCGFSARSAEKPQISKKSSTAVPEQRRGAAEGKKADHVSPVHDKITR